MNMDTNQASQAAVAASQAAAVARQKRLKAGTACTNCRKKKLRCTGTPNCARCVTHNLDCVVDEALFLKTNSAQSLIAKTAAGTRLSTSSSPNNDIKTSPSTQRLDQQRHSHPYHPVPHSKHHHQQQYSYPSDPYYHRGHGSSSSGGSGDEMMDTSRHDPRGFHADRRMSASSMTSLSSLSPGPSSPTTFGYNAYPHLGSSSSSSSSNYYPKTTSDPRANTAAATDLSQKSAGKATKSRPPAPTISIPNAGTTGSYSSPSTSSAPTTASKKRASKDQGSTKPKQKRTNSKAATESSSMGSNLDADPCSPTLPPQDSSKSTKKNGEQKSVVSTMSLDGHGQHFHGSSSGFYVCQLSSRYRQGVYPLPMAHLNDSDLWSHSLQMTSERELPSKEQMEVLLNLYFQFMYPFAPMFIRRTFMDDFRQNRPDLSQILILNAIFSNACWYSDDPALKQESTKYFNRAKIILDETYHVSRISTVQALLLMAHHQYATGNYSGGWLYTGMSIRIAQDIGLHRQDVNVDEPEEAEVRKRLWWSLYMADRLGSAILGRPMTLRDEGFNVQMPTDEWIVDVLGEDTVEYPYEPESVISCRLIWSIKLFMQLGKVLDTMHCIEAEINGSFLADISRTQLPQLHNSLTSWFLSLPNELMYTPYTMSPNSNHPPSPPTALMHMFYYTTLTILHRPYLRPVNSESIDSNFLLSSRNICTAAATNVCHIADSLMLHGQLRDTCYYGMACLVSAGTVHVHNAITPTPSNRETTRAGLSKTVKAAHELVRTFPVAESLIAVALDVFASQTSSVPTEMAASFIDISTFVAPFMDMTQLQSASIGNIYEAARLAKLAKDGPGPTPSIQLRHPYGNFSMPLPESTKDQSATTLSSMWQAQIATAVAMAAIAFGGTDPQQEQQFFADPLELPEALRLAPIDSMLFGQIDSVTGTPDASVDPFGTDTSSFGFDVSPLQQQQQQAHVQTTQQLQQQQQSHLLQYQPTAPVHIQQRQQLQQPIVHSQSHAVVQDNHIQFSSPTCTTSTSATTTSTASSDVSTNAFTAAQTQSLMQELTSNLTSVLQMHQTQSHHQSTATSTPTIATSAATSAQIQQQQQQLHAMMEDDTADPPSPPAIFSDDMDMESSSLSDDPDLFISPTTSSSSSSSSSTSRHDVQIQCQFDDVDVDGAKATAAAREAFLASLTKVAVMGLSGTNSGLQQQQQQGQDKSSGVDASQKDVDKVNTLLFDGQAMEC
ncbi:hypothetical protein BG015_009614 [Linnemannia schmuckeri]|uniref:Zn(2)-C6 fungal-type domain-containing protein n=2 Tax=Linnemannia TaxID=2779861 RepID=A0A9P5RVP1_9FUNG|nr:hypothetical protein BG015_009614 [Linnemannia schmuckeri]